MEVGITDRTTNKTRNKIMNIEKAKTMVCPFLSHISSSYPIQVSAGDRYSFCIANKCIMWKWDVFMNGDHSFSISEETGNCAIKPR